MVVGHISKPFLELQHNVASISLHMLAHGLSKLLFLDLEPVLNSQYVLGEQSMKFNDNLDILCKHLQTRIC